MVLSHAQFATVIVVALIGLVAGGVWLARQLDAQVESVSLRVVHVEAGARSMGTQAGGRIDAALVLEVEGAGILARTARAVELNVIVEGVPVGSVLAEPVGGGPLEGPVLFRADIHAEIPSQEAIEAIHRRAIDSHPGTLKVEAQGVLYLPLGVTRHVEVEGLAPFGLGASYGPGSVAFGGARQPSRGVGLDVAS